MRRIFFCILFIICISCCGCAGTAEMHESVDDVVQQESNPQQLETDTQDNKLSSSECYEALTESDKQLYDTLLLYQVLNQYDDISNVRISSIRESTYTQQSASQKPLMYYISIINEPETDTSQQLFYAYYQMDGERILLPVSFEKDPTEWDFAEESKYDVEGINETLHAYARELNDFDIISTNLSKAEVENNLTKCRTFAYIDGPIEGEHSVTRVDLGNGTYKFLTFTSKGTKLSDRVLEFSMKGSYTVDIASNGIAYLVLEGNGRFPILFYESGGVAGIIAAGYEEFGGNIAAIKLPITDRQ